MKKRSILISGLALLAFCTGCQSFLNNSASEEDVFVPSYIGKWDCAPRRTPNIKFPMALLMETVILALYLVEALRNLSSISRKMIFGKRKMVILTVVCAMWDNCTSRHLV